MKGALEKLERHREINLDPTVREKLSKVSASTIDRLLKPERDRFRLWAKADPVPNQGAC